MKWPLVQLGEACILVTKGTTPTTLGYEFSDSGIPFLRAQNLVNGSVNIDIDPLFIDNVTHQALSRSVILPNDVLIAIAGTIGRSALVQASIHQANCNQAVAIIRCSKILLPAYLKFALHSKGVSQQIFNAKVTATISNLSLGEIKKIKIPLPPLPEQQRIAALLEKVDHLRSLRRQSLKRLDDLVQATFLEMFGDAVTNPMGWKTELLSHIAMVRSGVTKGRKLSTDEIVEVPYMRVANVQDGYLNLKEIKKIQVLPTDVEKYSLEYGDILLTEGGDLDKLGRGAIWRDEIKPCIHQNHIFCVRLQPEFVTSEFFCSLTGSLYGKNYFLKQAKQTTGIASINSTQLKAFPVLLPPLSMQRRYSNFTEKLEVKKIAYKTSLAQLDTLFNTLMHQAFNGELNWKEAEQAVTAGQLELPLGV